jgi:hypothetical protein
MTAILPFQQLTTADASSGDAKAAWWLRLAIACWIVGAVALTVKTILNPTSHTVYPIFHEAGGWMRHGESLYADRGPEPNEFYYSPVFAMLLVPFSYLPLWAGGVAWGWFSLGLFFLSLRRFFAVVVQPWQPKLIEGQFLCLAALTAGQGGWSNQSNSLLMSLVLLGAAELVRGGFWRAALFLAAPVHVKVWPIVAGALLSVRYAKQLPWRLAMCIGLLAATPLAMQSRSDLTASYAEWSEKLADREQGNDRYGGYRDAWTIMENTIGAPSLPTYKLLQALTGLAVLAWCVRNAWQAWSSERWVVSTLGWWLVWQLLFGPGTERLTYGIIAPLAAWAVVDSMASQRRRTLAWSVWLLTGLLGTGEAERAFLKLWSGAEIMTPLGAMLLGVWLAVRDCQGNEAVAMEPNRLDGTRDRVPIQRAA